MASAAPLEVLALIAGHVAADGGKFGSYALVNKSWQAAFEPILYGRISVHSPSGRPISDIPQEELYLSRRHGMTLDQLTAIITGPQEWQRTRHQAIRRIVYEVGVPYFLEDGRSKDNDYTYDNAFRRENDAAFSDSIRRLFECLSRWTDKRRPISLGIKLHADNIGVWDREVEPRTHKMERYDERRIPPYSANFTSESHLPVASCVASLDFPHIDCMGVLDTEHRISAPAALMVASACGGKTLLEVSIGGTHIRSTDTALAAEKRSASADNLLHLPCSVRSLNIDWGYEPGMSTGYFPPISIHPDAFSVALHRTSMHLRKLSVQYLDIFPEFFWPSGSEARSTPRWPYLEILCLTEMPGSNTSYHVAFRYLDGLFESIGHAAQEMPNMNDLFVSFVNEEYGVRLIRERDGRQFLTLTFPSALPFDSSDEEYFPSRQVLQAWRVPEGHFDAERQEAVFETWPPCSPG